MGIIDQMRLRTLSNQLRQAAYTSPVRIVQLRQAAAGTHAHGMAQVLAAVGDLTQLIDGGPPPPGVDPSEVITALAYELRRARGIRAPSPGLRALAMIGKAVAIAAAAYVYHLHVRPPGLDAYRAPTDFDRATVDTFSAHWKGGAWRQVYATGECLARTIGRAPFDAAWVAEQARRAAVWSAELRARVAASDAQRRERERWSNAVQPDDAEAYDVGAKDAP